MHSRSPDDASSQENIMCPICMTTTAVLISSTASGAGVLGFIIAKLRARRSRSRHAFALDGRRQVLQGGS